MKRLSKKNLGQMDRQYFQSLEKDALVDVACRLHATAVELTERFEQNSSNSSRPPSSDNPYKKNPKNKQGGQDSETPDPPDSKHNKVRNQTENESDNSPDSQEDSNEKPESESDNPSDSQGESNEKPESGSDNPSDSQEDSNEKSESESDNPSDSQGESNEKPESGSDNPSDSQDESIEKPGSKNEKRSPGKQKGAQGRWRNETPVADDKEHHYPEMCEACGKKLDEDPTQSPDMAFYTFELEKSKHSVHISCTIHYYYTTVCECGCENTEEPGQGAVSVIEGRERNLKLSEYTMVGPMLATYIAMLNRDYGISRKKIRDHLKFLFDFELSVGTICKCIREAGFACYPVVEQLVEELQKEKIVHLDETTWWEKGKLLWLWVAVSVQVAVYHIGTRKKEELLNLITEAFFGWLVTDGYGAYRSYEKRQRCLAHLIRKAVALAEGVDGNAQKMGDWFLRELRGMITAMAEGEDGKKKCWPILARLKRACNLGSESDHDKLRALAREILNDWDAVVAFVKNPELPATNNEAERALRWAVILRRIGFGTRTDEGSRTLAALLSVIKTCRLRNINHWDYIAQVIAAGRKGIAPPPIPREKEF